MYSCKKIIISYIIWLVEEIYCLTKILSGSNKNRKIEFGIFWPLEPNQLNFRLSSIEMDESLTSIIPDTYWQVASGKSMTIV